MITVEIEVCIGSGIFKKLRDSVVVPDVLSTFSKIGNVSSSEKVYDVSNS